MKSLIVIFFLFASIQSAAQIIFQKAYGTLGVDNGYYAQQTADSGYIIIGVINWNIGLLKINASGDLMWTKTFNGYTEDMGNFVQQTSDGGYIVTGYTQMPGAGTNDVVLIRTDANGDSLWVKTFGGTENDMAYCVQQTTDGGFIITGITTSVGPGDSDLFLIKTDSNGDLLWAKSYGETTSGEWGHSVKQTSDGGYIVAGSSQSGFTSAEVYLIKTDSAGNLLWSKTYGGSGLNGGFSVEQTTDGGYVIAGETDSFGAGGDDVLIIKTDNTGNLLWTKTYGGIYDEGGTYIQQTTDGGYIVTGFTSSFNVAHYNIYLIKTNSIGDTLWTTTFGGPGFGGTGSEFGESVQQTFDGGYIISGVTSGLGIPNSMNNYYLIKTDSLGNSGCNQISMPGIVLTPALVVGNPMTLVNSIFNVTLNTFTIVAGGSIMSICSGTVGLNEITTDNTFFVSPNPSTGNFEITFPHPINNGKIQIHNILGEDVFSERIINESEKEINLNNISQGVYFVKVFDGDKYFCKKLIVEGD